MGDDAREILSDFVNESREMLAEIEPALLELEATCVASGVLDRAQIDSVFRAFHSMKGSASFLDLSHVVRITHAAESLLDLFRQERAQLESTHITVLCKALDFARRLVDEIDSSCTDESLSDEADELERLLVLEIERLSEDPSEGRDAAAMPGSGAQPPGPEAQTQGSDPRTTSSESLAASPEAEAARPEDNAGSDDWQPSVTPELIDQFLNDSAEQLEAAERSLLRMQQDPGCDAERDHAFRALHSFKGNCSFMGFGELETRAHALENVLDELRSGEREPTAELLAGLVTELDALSSALESVQGGSPAAAVAPRDPALPDAQTDPVQSTKAVEVMPAEAAPAAAPRSPSPPPAVKAATAKAPGPSTGTTPPESDRAASGGTANSRGSIRVDLEKLDMLMDLVGELITAETMVTHNQDLEGQVLENFTKAALQLNRITRSLQDVAMSARMVPIGGTFRKMLRLVRDLSQKQAKRVELQIAGEETEVDKTVVEAISDPLVHIIRNAVDHGIESAVAREQAGKPRHGTVRLEALHQGGEIWIVIEDDGKGLDREVILAKGRERGLVDPTSTELRESEVFNLLFEPGFSTAEAVTDVSGRGVGMDVVKRNIEKLRGRVDVSSRLGKGTTFTIRIPLTLAIIEGMLVSVGDATYTIPLLSVRESVVARLDDITRLPDGDQVVRIREQLLPVLMLSEIHQIERANEDIEKGILVVVEENGVDFCIFVDSIVGQRQTVIKALPEYLGDVAGISGCSILANGEISLILDLRDLAPDAEIKGELR